MSCRSVFAVAALCFFAIVAAPLAAQQPEALSSEDVQAYLGPWFLELAINGNPAMKMGLEIDEEDGTVAATVTSQIGVLEAKSLMKDGDDLVLVFASPAGDLSVKTHLEGGELVGSFGDRSGSFSATLHGRRSTRGELERLSRPANETRISEGDDLVRLRFVDPPADAADYEQIETAAVGDIVRFLEHPAIKLTTDLDLALGALELPAANIASNYPGVYSLWLKRSASGWILVANSKADVWGTQHDPAADVGEVELRSTTLSEPSGAFEAEFVEVEAGRELVLRWGSHAWSVPVVVASGG